MNAKLLLSMSLRNVRRQGRKSVGTLVVMAVSILALCLLAGYMQSNVELIQNAFMRWGARGHLVIERPASQLAREVEGAGQNPIGATMQAGIDKVLAADPDVAARARILRVSGMVSNARVSTIFAGIGQDVQEVRRIKGPAYEYDVVAGTPLWQETRAHPLVLGQGLAAILGCEVPKVGFAPAQPGQTPASRPMRCSPGPLELTVSTRGTARINATQALPTGIMDWGIKEINDRLVVMPMAEAQALLNTREISEYHVLLADGADLDAARDRLSAAQDRRPRRHRVPLVRPRGLLSAGQGGAGRLPQLHRHRRRHRRLHQPAQRQLHELRPARARIRHPAQPGLHPPLRDDAHRAGKQLAGRGRGAGRHRLRAGRHLGGARGQDHVDPARLQQRGAGGSGLGGAGLRADPGGRGHPGRAGQRDSHPKILRRPIRSVLSEG